MDQVLLLRQAMGSSPSTLDTQLVFFLWKRRVSYSGGESSCGRMGICCTYSNFSMSSSTPTSALCLFLPFFSLSALQAGDISNTCSTIRLQFSNTSFSLSQKEVILRKIVLSSFGLMRILLTPAASIHSWYLSLNRSLTPFRKWLQRASVLSLSDFLAQQEQKRRQACRLRICPCGFSDQQMCTYDLNSPATSASRSRSNRHLLSSRMYSRKSSSNLFSSNFLASTHSRRSRQKVRKGWSLRYRNQWYPKMAIRWTSARAFPQNSYFQQYRHSCAYFWASSSRGSGLSLTGSGSRKL